MKYKPPQPQPYSAETAATITRLKDRIKRLEDWKRSALEIEREWDANSIARMLGAKLGESQRKVIQREVPRLLERIKRLEDRIHRAGMAFFRDGSDGQVASGMLAILEEERRKQ